MDQDTLVSEQIRDGRRLAERFAVDGSSVTAAFWARDPDERRWSFYLATNLIDAQGALATYGAILESQSKLGNCEITDNELTALSPADPVTLDVIAASERHPGKSFWLRNARLGRTNLDLAYIYAAHWFTPTHPNPMTLADVSQEIMRRFLSESPQNQTARVALKDGTTFNGTPFEVRRDRDGVAVQFIAEDELPPRSVRLDDIASIA